MQCDFESPDDLMTLSFFDLVRGGTLVPEGRVCELLVSNILGTAFVRSSSLDSVSYFPSWLKVLKLRAIEAFRVCPLAIGRSLVCAWSSSTSAN